MSGPRRIADLLGADLPGADLPGPGPSSLAGLVAQADRQKRLDGLLRGYLDSPLRDHIRVAGIRDGTLVLAADTPVWGHRVRYLAPALLEHMRGQVPGLAQVRIIVRPPDRPSPRASRPAARSDVPRSAAGPLTQAADDCANPALARVLRRLAKRAR